jgi:hypothetical protein
VDYIHLLFIFFKVLDPNILYHSIDPRVLLLQASNLGIFSIIFLWNALDNKIWRLLRIHIKVHMLNILGSGSLYFWRYILCMIRFFTHHEFSFK